MAKNLNHIHLIGIGGTGLSAIALVLLQRGIKVSGSDQKASENIGHLQVLGAKITIGQKAENITNPDLVLRSSAVPDTNPEVQRAREKGIPVVKRIDFLPDLLKGMKTIGIAGTHGKTSTTSMLAWALTQSGLESGYIVGGEVANLGTNAAAGAGEWFVIEADEYDHMFLGLSPYIAVVTNIEHDHPDCYPTEESFIQAFRDYADRITPDGTLITFAGDPVCRKLAKDGRASGQKVILYGFAEDQPLDYSARNLVSVPNAGYSFDLYQGNIKRLAVQLNIPGRHNVLNALATLAVADKLGLPLEGVSAALGQFRGAGRRFDIKAEPQGILLVDDYGHHPTEINVTLQAARDRYPGRRILAVWQPHTYSRTQDLLCNYQAAFKTADDLIVLDVFAARETMPAGFDMQAVTDQLDHPSKTYIGGLRQAADHLLEIAANGDVIIVFSAGDANQITGWLAEELQ